MRYLSLPTFVTYFLLSGIFSWATTSPKLERRCKDGSLGIVRHVEANPNEPTIFTVDCPSTLPPQELSPYNSTFNLEKRGSCLSLSDCTRACYSGTTGPTEDDCQSLDSYLTNRASQTDVPAGQELQATWGSCMFRFTNSALGTVTLCDTFWAPDSGSIYRLCIGGTNPAGGYCSASTFKLDVCLNSATTVTTTTSTSASPAPVYVTPTSTTQTPQGNTQQSSSAVAVGVSLVSAASSASGSTTSGSNSNSNSKSSSTPATTHTVSYTNSLGLLTYSVDLPTASASIAQAFGPSISQKSGTNHTPAIVGAIFGVLVVIGILIALWLWRRRLRRREEQGVPIEDTRTSDPVRQSQMTAVARSSSGGRSAGDGGYGPVTMGFGSNSKVALMQRQAAPVSEYSDGPEHLFSPTQDSASTPSTPRTHTSYFYQTEVAPVGRARSEYDGLRRSVGARTLAQELAPNLSEMDITRLADTIVARMQAAAPPVTQRRESFVSNSEYTEPPPPWRASWNGRNDPNSTDTRSSAA